MPRAHHGGSPLTKRQQHAKTALDTAVAALAAGTDRPSIDAEPFDHGRWERAVTTHIAGLTPAPTVGGTLATTEENAALVRSQTEKVGEAVASIVYALDLLADAKNAAVGALGNTQGANTLSAQVEAVRTDLDAIQGRVMGLNQAFEDAAKSGA
ncbi:hypothetical protein [Amycolatopsis sp. cmx-4-83]|uniref:hypothetical protein n=1 Tax=Amycolatopsis sp. cmx-4-83 TaxID=2790940 RepID=UPI003979E219